ncbi:class I SAM-dependent methyltransferase [Bradyrhizobium jicamae]|nr:class I SAM-dependent methyltransferase [Bradyrhizobium jicamae]
MGRWSKRLASGFLEFTGLVEGAAVLDVGCGTGSLTFEIADRRMAASIDALDYEPEFVEAVNSRKGTASINVRRGDAMALPYASAQFDMALSLLVLHFVPDAARAISEMVRVVKPGGVVAAAVWDTFGGMPSRRMFWDTVAAIHPPAEQRRSALLIRPMTQPNELQTAFQHAGLSNVTSTLLTIRTDFESFEDFWLPAVFGQGTQSEFLAGLPEPTQQQIESSVRTAYLAGLPDGPRSFASSAWAVRGMVKL